jgi:hypothetical protein
MRAGDIKKFLMDVICSEARDNLDPREHNVNDNFILGSFAAYKNREPAEHIEQLINGYITTERLTVERRVAVLKMVKDVLMGLSKKDVTKEERERLKSLLTAYFI